jgi:hypothetical protein
MKRILSRSMLVVCLFVSMGAAAFAQDEGEEATLRRGRGRFAERMAERREARRQDGDAKGPKAGRGRKGGPLAWFLELDDVKAEMETHRENIRDLRKQAPEKVKAAIEAARADGEKPDPEAIRAEVEAALPPLAESMIEEYVRHHRALADLLEQHKADGADRLVEAIMQHLHGQHRDKGGGRDGDKPDHEPTADDDGMEGDFEGAVF